MTRGLKRIVLLAVAALSMGYILPGDRVLWVISQQREELPSMRVKVSIAGILDEWPREATIEIHPDLGLRIADDAGGRWIVRHGRVQSRDHAAPPGWLPDFEILALRDLQDLRAWFGRTGVSYRKNQLARCGDRDCFVLGGRRAERQVWIDKDLFDIHWIFSAEGRRIEFSGYRAWKKLRFPEEVRISDVQGEIATLEVSSVSPMTELTEGDFSPKWLEGQSFSQPAN